MRFFSNGIFFLLLFWYPTKKIFNFYPLGGILPFYIFYFSSTSKHQHRYLHSIDAFKIRKKKKNRDFFVIHNIIIIPTVYSIDRQYGFLSSSSSTGYNLFHLFFLFFPSVYIFGRVEKWVEEVTRLELRKRNILKWTLCDYRLER